MGRSSPHSILPESSGGINVNSTVLVLQNRAITCMLTGARLGFVEEEEE